jgi:hypothetical protein
MHLTKPKQESHGAIVSTSLHNSLLRYKSDSRLITNQNQTQLQQSSTTLINGLSMKLITGNVLETVVCYLKLYY